MKKYHFLFLLRDSITERVNFIKQFKVTLINRVEWSNSTLDLLLRNRTIEGNTDDSKTSEGIGIGGAGPRAKLSTSLGRFPIIFQAEVFAISRNESIAILSDS